MQWSHDDQQLILLQAGFVYFHSLRLENYKWLGSPWIFLFGIFMWIFQLNFNPSNPEVELSPVLGNRFH